MLRFYKIIPVLSYLFLLTGCLSNPVVPDYSCNESIPVELSEVDYLLFANKMIDDLTASNSINKLADQRRLNVFVAQLENTTPEAINLEQIKLAVENRLKRSAKFNLLDEPDQANYIVSGGFSETAGDCNIRTYEFKLIMQSKSSNQIVWSQHTNYFH